MFPPSRPLALLQVPPWGHSGREALGRRRNTARQREPCRAGGCMPRHGQQKTEPKVPPPRAAKGRGFPLFPAAPVFGMDAALKYCDSPNFCASFSPFPEMHSSTERKKQQTHCATIPRRALASPPPAPNPALNPSIGQTSYSCEGWKRPLRSSNPTPPQPSVPHLHGSEPLQGR